MELWFEAFFAGSLALCGTADVRRRVVPNALTLPLLAVGLARAAHTGAWDEALFGLAAAAALGLGGWLAGGLSGGDAKLMMAVGAWLGPRPALAAFALAALLGIAWGTAALARKGLLRERAVLLLRGLYLFPVCGFWGLVRRPADAEDPGAVPFGACLAAVLVPGAVFRVVLRV